MRLILVIVLSIMLSIATRMVLAGECDPCNQEVYDTLYETLIQDTLITADYKSKMNVVELLKKLCHDQSFSLELGKRHVRQN